MNSPLFSIVIPTYNRAHLIGTTIESISEQTFFDFEVIIVDDGSTDNTPETVAYYLADGRFRYFRIMNSERGAARNFGTANSTGQYVTFLDSDDVFLPWHLMTASEKIRQHPHAPVFHLGYEILHPDGRVDSLPVLPSPVNDKLVEGNFLSCMGVFLKREIAFENKFDEDRTLAGSEDYELWMRVACKYPILTFNEVTSRLINHTERSVIKTNHRKLIDRIDILDKKLNANPLFSERFGKDKRKFGAYRTLYLSLHMALSGQRWMAFQSLLHTAYLYPAVVFSYRFLVALKKIILW